MNSTLLNNPRFIIALLNYFIVFFCILFNFNSLYASGTHKLLISEFMVHNSNIIADEDSAFCDWIEIYNPGSTAVSLLNWCLTDKASDTAKWVFPNVTIQPNQYLVVFASGKDRRVPGSNLHTNFKLSEGDGFLAIVEPDGLLVSDYYDHFPEQYEDISYGLFNNSFCYFDKPTPGTANVAGNFVKPPVFSVTRGFFTSPFNVQLSTDLAGAKVRYTTNGNYPDTIKGVLYTTPINISKTTVLRAVVYNGAFKSMNVTNTYLFISDIKTQSNTPAGYPTTWGPYTGISGTAKADYEMDPEVVNNSVYKDSLDKAFKSIPTISVVTNTGYLFSKSTDPDTGGIYIYTGPPLTNTNYGTGYGWGRQASVECFDANKVNEFFANCRLEIHGGHSRRPEKNPKHSFNLEFKSEYGLSKLRNEIFDNKDAVKEFDALVLRGGFNNIWLHGDAAQRTRGMYIHDSWAKDTYLAMGEKTAHNKFVHLYLNGIYWGLYNLSERIDKDFMESYFKGKEDDFDIIKDYTEVATGTITAWNAMITMANAGLTSNTNYFKIQGRNPDGTDNPNYPAYVSVDNLIDYMLVNIYGGNSDWDHHNWSAGRNRVEPGNGFKFFIWDAEHIFEGLEDNVVDEYNANCPSNVYSKLRENAEFRIEFADHVQSHLFNNGDLTPAKVTERWMKRANEINLAIICESARWGDYRRDVHQWSGGPYALYTRNNQWMTEQTRLLTTYFPARTQIVIDQLKAVQLYPSLDAPVLSWYGGKFVDDTTVTITASAGTIYYTTDGTDPRSIGGNVSATAQTYNKASIALTDTTTIKTRVKSGAEWSAIVKADYYKLSTPTDTTPAPTGVLAGSQISNVFVYPNPCLDFAYFVFNMPLAGIVEITVFSMAGRPVSYVYKGNLPQGVNTIPWIAEKLSPGIYFYRIKYGGKCVTGKVALGAR